METNPEIFGINSTSRIVFLFPHPDDETFYSFGLIKYALNRGAAVKIICLTRGEAGNLNVATNNTVDISTVRTKEFERVMNFIGLKDFCLLNYPDGHLEERYQDIYNYIRNILEKEVFTHLVTFEPHGGYGHPDHILTSKTASNLLKDCKDKKLIYATYGGLIRKKKTLSAVKPNLALNLPWGIYFAKLKALLFTNPSFLQFGNLEILLIDC